jgi:hypothetical protein
LLVHFGLLLESLHISTLPSNKNLGCLPHELENYLSICLQGRNSLGIHV